MVSGPGSFKHINDPRMIRNKGEKYKSNCATEYSWPF